MKYANEAIYLRKFTCFSDCDDAEIKPFPSKVLSSKTGSSKSGSNFGSSSHITQSVPPSKEETAKRVGSVYMARWNQMAVKLHLKTIVLTEIQPVASQKEGCLRNRS